MKSKDSIDPLFEEETEAWAKTAAFNFIVSGGHT